MNPDSPRLRLGIVGVVAISLFAALFARLWFLQVMAAPEYKLAAERNQVRVVHEPAPRGRILDRNGEVLAENRVSAVVAVNRNQLPRDRRDEVLGRLGPLLGMAPDEIDARLADVRVSPFTPAPIAADVAEPALVYIKEHPDLFPGVEAGLIPVRWYPHGALGAHLLGYTGEINEDELEERRDDGYRLGDQIGKAGIERTYESDLRGRPGQEKLEVDATGRVLRTLGRRPPVPGNDVQLAVDIHAQLAAEQALAEGLERARGRRFVDDGTMLRATGGSVVVLDAKEGTIVAMASNPTYDPNAFVGGISSSVFAALNDPERGTPFLNRATQGEYAAGSTFKLVTALAGLRTGLVDGNTVINDTGSFTIPNCRGRCTFRAPRGYGRVDLAKAMTVSSDVYFYTLGYDFWVRRGTLGHPMQDVARSLGFGARTGAEVPSERPGWVPDPDNRRERHEANPRVFVEGNWYAGDNVNLSIGQMEFALTPIQLADAYATFANGGTRHQPNVAVRVLRPDGGVVREVPPRVAEVVDLGAAGRDALNRGLIGVVADPDGTAYHAFQGFPLDRIPVAGKTGTAQAKPRQDTALFAAYAPANDPRYVVSVIMEESGFGATAAAPVARAVFEVLFGLRETDDEPPPVDEALVAEPPADDPESGGHPVADPGAGGTGG